MRYNKLEKLFKLALDINGSLEYQYNKDYLAQTMEVKCENYKEFIYCILRINGKDYCYNVMYYDPMMSALEFNFKNDTITNFRIDYDKFLEQIVERIKNEAISDSKTV